MSTDIMPEDAMALRFHAYCRKAIDNAATEAYKFIRKNAPLQIQFSALSEKIADPHDPYAFIAMEFLIDNRIIPIWDGDLSDALMTLSAEEREVILRCFFVQQTEDDIAKLIHKSQRTVSNIKKRALMHLKKYMEEMA